MSKYADRIKAAQRDWDDALAKAERANAGPDDAETARENQAAANYGRALIGLDPKGGR
jgi:hypothetical protein